MPLRKDWALVKAGTLHKQKKIRRFQTISFRLTMLISVVTLSKYLIFL